MRKHFHIWLFIIGLPTLIFLAPIVPIIFTHMMQVVIVLALTFGLLAFIAGTRFDVLLSAVIATDFMASLALFPGVDQLTLALRTAAITAFVFLNFVLLIGPWARFSKTVMGWYQHRRHLGVTTFMLALLHFSLVFSNYFSYSFANTFLSFFAFFGFTALFIMFFLALTSWDWMQKHVGNTRWKKIHLGVMVLYTFVLGYAIWVHLKSGQPIEPYNWIVFAAFFLFWFIVAPWGLAPKIVKFLNGWKQLHVLVHIAYASLVLHVWLGVAFAQPVWIKVIFFSLISLTWGSHLTGWIIKAQEDRRLKEQAAASKSIEIEGKLFWSVGRADQFAEGKGQKFLVNKLPVAVFKYQGKFFGLFAICAHQKGPIEKGAIVNGYVECPWHHWQYSCESGVGPPGFSDRLAYYPCVVQEGIVYVSSFPKRAENMSST